MVVPTWNPSTGRWRQEDQRLKVILSTSNQPGPHKTISKETEMTWLCGVGQPDFKRSFLPELDGGSGECDMALAFVKRLQNRRTSDISDWPNPRKQCFLQISCPCLWTTSFGKSGLSQLCWAQRFPSHPQISTISSSCLLHLLGRTVQNHVCIYRCLVNSGMGVWRHWSTEAGESPPSPGQMVKADRRWPRRSQSLETWGTGLCVIQNSIQTVGGRPHPCPLFPPTRYLQFSQHVSEYLYLSCSVVGGIAC